MAAKQNWWQEFLTNVKNSTTPSEFICDRYEKRPYETNVLKPEVHLPFTEIFPKKRHCIKWEDAPRSAIGRTCVEYSYEHTSPIEQQGFYHKVIRYRTVCVDGHKVPN